MDRQSQLDVHLRRFLNREVDLEKAQRRKEKHQIEEKSRKERLIEKEAKAVGTAIDDIRKDGIAGVNYLLVIGSAAFLSVFSNPLLVKCEFRWVLFLVSSLASLILLSCLILLTFNLWNIKSPYYKPLHKTFHLVYKIVILTMLAVFLGVVHYGIWNIPCSSLPPGTGTANANATAPAPSPTVE